MNFFQSEKTNAQAPVVRKVANAIQRINIQWIAWFVLLTLMRWITIYPVESAIRLRTTWGQVSVVPKLTVPCHQISRQTSPGHPYIPWGSETQSCTNPLCETSKLHHSVIKCFVFFQLQSDQKIRENVYNAGNYL